MTGQRTLLSGAIGRMAVGLLTAAAVVLLAPVAAATPESDADGAITQAWDASGGPTGPLGAKEGGVYPVGEGFGQNFAGGKIFFTPATGAHVMHGVILEKYESLGGPADSDLGWPTIDEGPGRIGPDSRNSTFSAGDKPVIFWTPATGARVVRGAINAAWDKLGGSAGPLGGRAFPSRMRPTAARSSRRNSPAESCRGTRRPRLSRRCRPSWPDNLTGSRSRTTPPRPSTRPAARRAVRWVRWVPRRASSTTWGPTAPVRILPAARSSTARRPGARRHRPGPGEVRERRWATG